MKKKYFVYKKFKKKIKKKSVIKIKREIFICNPSFFFFFLVKILLLKTCYYRVLLNFIFAPIACA